jgi:thiol-disulfide isomerase/thioredoxin
MKANGLARIVVAAVMGVGVPALVEAQNKDSEYASEIDKGSAALAKRDYEAALKAYKRASALRDKKSADAHHGMARAYFGLGALKSVVDACDDAVTHVGDDRLLEAQARNLRGTALFQQAEKADDKRLTEAESDFRAVLALSDRLPAARYNLGVVLLRANRDEEGVRELKTFLTLGGRSADVEEAKRMIENPRRAREPYAPDFSLVTIDGRHLALEDLRGKAVLLDFWGTWCPPCRAATPDLVRLRKKMAERPFVVIGISSDRDEQVLREYVEKNKMDWPQFFDGRREIQRLFNVNVFPTYVLIDHEGIIRGRKAAYGPDTERWLDSQVKKQVKATETVK